MVAPVAQVSGHRQRPSGVLHYKFFFLFPYLLFSSAFHWNCDVILLHWRKERCRHNFSEAHLPKPVGRIHDAGWVKVKSSDWGLSSSARIVITWRPSAECLSVSIVCFMNCCIVGIKSVIPHGNAKIILKLLLNRLYRITILMYVLGALDSRKGVSPLLPFNV